MNALRKQLVKLFSDGIKHGRNRYDPRKHSRGRKARPEDASTGYKFSESGWKVQSFIQDKSSTKALVKRMKALGLETN